MVAVPAIPETAVPVAPIIRVGSLPNLSANIPAQIDPSITPIMYTDPMIFLASDLRQVNPYSVTIELCTTDVSKTS